MFKSVHKLRKTGKIERVCRRGTGVSAEDRTAFLKEVQAKFEKKVRENEISVLEYWKEQLDRIVAMKPEGIASLQLQIKKTSEMMGNRIRTLKKG